MARSIVWPQVAAPAEIEPAEPAHGLDLTSLAASFGPELARRMGLRVTAAADAEAAPSAEPPVRLGSLPLEAGGGGPEALHIGCSGEAGAMLLERLFGAPAAGPSATAGADLLALPPGSASWMALCRTILTALGAALAASGRKAAGSADLPARAAALPDGLRMGLALDVDGTACRLWLVPQAARPALPAAPAPDVAAFRRAARARALDLELPVALRVAERRISIAQASALSVGDIIPIDPLPMPEVLAGGRRIAKLPGRALGAAPVAEEGQ
jgi:hypothetical protein